MVNVESGLGGEEEEKLEQFFPRQTCDTLLMMIVCVIDSQDSRYFELDRVTGSVTVKRAIPEDDLLQPITAVIRVSERDLLVPGLRGH